MKQSDDFITSFAAAPIIPVVTLQHADDAVPLSLALLEGGITSIEITLRSAAGLAGIAAIARANVPISLGAGTVLSADQMQRAHEVGAQFMVSPGATPALLAKAAALETPYLPGVVTPSEVVQARDFGFYALKLFPAGSVGGIGLLRDYASVFADVRFCPTGGVSHENLNDYLALSNVFAVGGSWLTPKEVVAAKDWPRITQIARESVVRTLQK